MGRCKVQTALDLAFSLLAGNMKMSRQDRARIESVLDDHPGCAFREIAEGFLELFDEGLLCGECPYYDKRRTNACRYAPEEDEVCEIWGLAERARWALGKTKGRKEEKQ